MLTKSRWLLLKRPENLTDKQDIRLAEFLQYNLRFRACHGAEIALYHALGALPEPEFTHRFC